MKDILFTNLFFWFTKKCKDVKNKPYLETSKPSVLFYKDIFFT